MITPNFADVFYDVIDVFSVDGLIISKGGNISSFFLIPNKYLLTLMFFADVSQILKPPKPA
jgi:hypothetical protein